MPSCSGIFQGSIYDCTDPLIIGLKQNLYLANYDDVESVTYSAVSGEENVITDITMKTGKAFFKVEGVNASLSTNQEQVRTATATGWRHYIDFSIFDVSSQSRLNINAMSRVKLVAITLQPNDTSLGNGPIEVHGWDAGLELITATRNASDAETGGAYRLQLATPENGRENRLPEVFWSTNYTTTETAVEDLLTPAP